MTKAFQELIDIHLTTVRAMRAVPQALAEPALYPALSLLLDGFFEQEGIQARAVPQGRTEFGVPDFVIDMGGPIGYVEAKRPRLDLSNLRGRDLRQQESFKQLPNLLYTNYLDFQLFIDGELVWAASLGGPELLEPWHPQKPSVDRIKEIQSLLRRFASHRVVPPSSAGELAHMLARATRVLRDATASALRAAPDGAVGRLRGEWKAILFEEATDSEFADAYAQTVAYGFLTARLEMDGPLNANTAVDRLEQRHPFLGSALRLLTYPSAREEVGWAYELVIQILDGVSHETFVRSRHPDDPLLYFYEDFLAEYDRELQKRRGVYYTPASVVGFQVRSVADLLSGLGRPRLLADDVIALDPAAGTGTYLLGLLDETATAVRKLDGEAALPAAASKPRSTEILG